MSFARIVKIFKKDRIKWNKVVKNVWDNNSDIEYYFEEDFQHLPPEILIKIFKYLSSSDRHSVSLVCHRWFEASKYFRFMNAICFHFRDISFEDSLFPINIFNESERYFPNIYLSRVHFNGRSDFWTQFGGYVKEISFDNCRITRAKLTSIIKNLPFLEMLNIIECNEFFKEWKHVDNKRVYPILTRMTHLSLAKNNYFNSDQLTNLILMSPNLSSLDLTECFKNCEAAKRIDMLNQILDVITMLKDQLKELLLKGTPIDDMFLLHLSEINGLELTSLSLTYCDKIPQQDPGIIALLRNQKNILHLDLSASLGLNDFCLTQIANHMLHLKTLKLAKCWMMTDYGVKELATLRRLEVLDLTNCERITDDGMFEGVVDWHKNLKELHLGMLNNISETVIFRMAMLFKDLTVLDLSGSSNCTNDQCLQYIFCSLRSLKSLNLDCCAKISDVGLTGVHIESPAIVIWGVAQVFSINSLKNLQSLKLSGCYKITNFALQHSFRFLNLKEISIARCQQITERGIKKLVLGCPALESVDLSECQEINDNCIFLVTKHLSRLTTLKLFNCPLLGELTLDYIANNCKVLKNLHLRGCYIIPSNVEERLAKVSTLKNIFGI